MRLWSRLWSKPTDPPIIEPVGIEPRVRELLLLEARERYKAEHDRNAQAYTRIGIFVAIFVMYINILIRFIDKPPALVDGWMYGRALHFLFWIAGFVFLVSIFFGVFCAIMALRPHAATYIARTGEWLNSLDGFRKYLEQSVQPAAMEEALERDLEERQLIGLAKSIDLNYRQNNDRVKWVHITSYAVLSGFSTLSITITLYAILLMKAPQTPPNLTTVKILDPVPLAPGVTSVRIADSVQLAPNTTTVRIVDSVPVAPGVTSVKVIDPVQVINHASTKKRAATP